MNPIEKQNIENFRARLQARWQPRPWHARLRSLPIKAWRFVVWWFVGDEDEKTARRLWRDKLHLERCWELAAVEGKE
ncbi:hypothetical protein D0962_01850 [Leptolyngbyaceae cyanobacterium CCMR0082]|uniref:Uncharacterized protein n=1 Tax=Adonisia turfae CCMR0082 TaxID=2304604 RepID=A0A6M0RZ82_9CYAN|nr:hypothetical protein [Adonisia turfae CCMR0082]